MIHPVPAQTMSQLERKMTEARVAFDEQKVQAWRWRPVAAGAGPYVYREGAPGGRPVPVAGRCRWP